VINEAAIRRRFETLSPYLDERQRRVFATSEALVAGWGGIAAVSRITGIARSTIGHGLDELAVGGHLRNIEIGLVTYRPEVAATVDRHFEGLVERGYLRALPLKG
jgi:hypothetical protein